MSRYDNWQHPAITAALCIVLIGLPPVFCAAAPLVFLGREHAQAEYRWIETYGHGQRANLPWWGGFDGRVWDVHSWWWNLGLPVLISGAAAPVLSVF